MDFAEAIHYLNAMHFTANMNVFRFISHMSRLVAVYFLVCYICNKKSCAGISGKTQLLMALTCFARYLDIQRDVPYVYDIIMKILLTLAAVITLYLIYCKYRSSYNNSQDSFFLLFVLIPACVYAGFLAPSYDFLTITYVFSTYTGATAILPQLYMIIKEEKAEKCILYYVSAFTCATIFALMDWTYRQMTWNDYTMSKSLAINIVEAVLYALTLIVVIKLRIKQQQERQKCYEAVLHM